MCFCEACFQCSVKTHTHLIPWDSTRHHFSKMNPPTSCYSRYITLTFVLLCACQTDSYRRLQSEKSKSLRSAHIVWNTGGVSLPDLLLHHAVVSVSFTWCRSPHSRVYCWICRALEYLRGRAKLGGRRRCNTRRSEAQLFHNIQLKLPFLRRSQSCLHCFYHQKQLKVSVSVFPLQPNNVQFIFKLRYQTFYTNSGSK